MALGRRKVHLVRRLALAGAVLAAAPACEDLRPGPRQPPAAIVLEDVVLRQYGQEGLEGIGTAREVSYLRGSGQLAGRSLLVDALSSPRVGRGGLHVQAREGRADVNGRTVVLSGGVDVSTGEGDHARSDSARYAAADDVLRSEDSLAADGPGYELTSSRWQAHVRERRLELSQGAWLRVKEAR